MTEQIGEDEIIRLVTLLGIYKRKSDENLEDVMEILVETGMYPNGKKQAAEIFETLRNESLISGDGLSMLGVLEAQKADALFKQ